MNTKVKIAGVEFKNPVIAASGTFGFGKEFSEYIDLNKLGGICSKGLTLHRNLGNKGVRIHETASGIMNSIGLQNPGIDYFTKEELPFLEKFDTVAIANLGGHSVEDYVKGADILDKTSVPMIELNISCPNVKEGGMAFGTEPKKACEVIKKVRNVTKKPLIVKLSPNVGSIGDFAKIAEDEGADAISLINTINAMAIDIRRKRPVFENKTAGLSGPCVKPIAVRMTYEAASVVNIPVIGMGGIMTYEDAIEFIMAGASAIQVGTANFIDYKSMENIIDGISNFMKEENIEDLEEIRGII
ncbi:Dihydroorotate dehydrogenase B (NAD(+)), catalytic subunit [Anaerococcus prevotii]|uniref:Dihydroorotate dehydrogenase n=1 Tax=Anaerococcus prevotii (strain ATCC 9321 / DSM 20548 / JCM 6508 / NCTC 11806 / PC1) TaxID=525919 RepID=C7RH52_ANAPD|nr:dihydroorotate dehydrogenase [Anaerococcus prevotii]ACV28813.1 dihydroorotate dehydrogenase family protein [Anaerococcus prevotii DSM 20548]SUU94488.1 Dihydroorotate dehydrogenase B (NAD(+)), catalytic subunit [Anaerococcus prevotii]